MRYEKADNLLQLALDLQASRGGLSLKDIEGRFDVSRRTAMRMRDAVLRNFPQAEEIPTDEKTKRWRIPSGTLNKLISFDADELADLETAASLLKREKRHDEADRLNNLLTKLKVLMPPQNMRRVEPDIEALLEAEGLAMRAGPKMNARSDVIANLREAIKSCRRVRLSYNRRSDRKRKTTTIEPYGFLHGHRNYLIAKICDKDGGEFLMFSLPGISKAEVLDNAFEREPDFDLETYAQGSFGLFQEEPIDVVWNFKPEAAKTAEEFEFHPKQKIKKEKDGSLTVSFTAGGEVEMAWHLYCWGDKVKVVKPKSLADKVHGCRVKWGALP